MLDHDKHPYEPIRKSNVLPATLCWMGPISARTGQFLTKLAIRSQVMLSGCHVIYPNYLSIPGRLILIWLI